jgi:hypothetical protein
MDAAIVGAASAILGSVVGGLASLATSWVTQSQKLRSERLDRTLAAREALYSEFIREGARLLAHAVEHEDGSVSEIVPLLSVAARMRLSASREVIEEAEKFVALAFNFYGQPNLTLRNVSDFVHQRYDPMKAFSEACRLEIESLRH